MKTIRKNLNVIVEHDITLGNGAITLTVEHQFWFSRDKDNEIVFDIDFSDYRNIMFMGMPINGYDAVKKFKSHLSEIGINFDEMLDEAVVGIITDKQIEEIKQNLSI